MVAWDGATLEEHTAQVWGGNVRPSIRGSLAGLAIHGLPRDFPCRATDRRGSLGPFSRPRLSTDFVRRVVKAARLGSTPFRARRPCRHCSTSRARRRAALGSASRRGRRPCRGRPRPKRGGRAAIVANVPVSRAAGAPFVQRQQRRGVLEEHVLEAYEGVLDDGLASGATLQRSEGVSLGRQAACQLGHGVAGRGLIQAEQRLEWPRGLCLEPADGILPADLSQPPSAARRMLLHIAAAATSQKAAREGGNEEQDAPARACCGHHSTNVHAVSDHERAGCEGSAVGVRSGARERLTF